MTGVPGGSAACPPKTGTCEAVLGDGVHGATRASEGPEPSASLDRWSVVPRIRQGTSDADSVNGNPFQLSERGGTVSRVREGPRLVQARASDTRSASAEAGES